MLKQRVITAIILIAMTLAILFYTSNKAFLYITAIVTLAAGSEWVNLMSLQRLPAKLAYIFLLAFVMYGALYVPAQFVFFCATVWWLLAIPLIILYPRGTVLWRHVIIRGWIGLIVLVPCWVALNVIRYKYSALTLLFLFLLIWGADTAAYFVGKKWGKTKLMPHVSPGKSIQGAIGAFIFSTVLALLALWISHAPATLWPYEIALCMFTILFSIEGDLLESMLKRNAGIKDSGNLLPGHGGLLDRIDSLTAAAPVFAFGSGIIGNLLLN